MSSSFTETGTAELLAAIMDYPAAEEASLSAVAEQQATQIAAEAKATLAAQLETPRHALIDAITIEPGDHRYTVSSAPPAGEPAMLPAWIEYGTIHMHARPYMRPPGDRAKTSCKAEMTAAVGTTAAAIFGS